GRAWPPRARVPGSAGRRAERRSAEARRLLPYVQRLHDGTAHGPRLGLLSARSVLCRARGCTENPRGADRRPHLVNLEFGITVTHSKFQIQNSQFYVPDDWQMFEFGASGTPSFHLRGVVPGPIVSASQIRSAMHLWPESFG